MRPAWQSSPIFLGMSQSDIKSCLECSGAKILRYNKDEMIFSQQRAPKKLLILLEGSVVVGSDSSSGKRSIIAAFDQPGELFAEVFLFVDSDDHDQYAQAVEPCAVLQIPREFLYQPCGHGCGCHSKMIANMLSILARKAYFLSRKLQIVSCATLRQKIAKLLLEESFSPEKPVRLMKREEMADFLNVTRPSLSRELMKMQKDGILKVEKREISIADYQRLQELL
ncbi:MAG: Crp/Fnr family transcriptional regulator [Christensenellales bacterium]